MFIGTGALSKKKLDTSGSRVPAVGFQKTKFAHKASIGATGFNLSSLTVPPEMSANGFANPTIGVLAAAQLLFFRRNLRLWSSVRGDMTDFYEYTVSSSNQITFLGFTAEEGEIFEGTIDYNATPGVQVVTSLSPPATGSLAATLTDFPVGFPFQTGINSTTQIGSVLVIKGGQVMLRNTGNATAAPGADGDYQEVDSGSGLGTIIRFNKADPDNAQPVAVIPNGRVAEMPNGSMMAVIEALNGQVNNMSTYVAALAGVLQATVLGSAPTNVNLMTFGQIVTSLQSNAALKNVANTWTAAQALPGRTDGGSAASGNIGQTLSSSLASSVTALGSTTNTPVTSLVLPAGTWLVYALATYTQVAGETPSGQVGWAVTTSNNIFSNSLPQVNLAMVASGSTFNTATQVSTVPFLLPTTGQTVFLNAYAQYSGTAPTFGGQIFAIRFI